MGEGTSNRKERQANHIREIRDLFAYNGLNWTR